MNDGHNGHDGPDAPSDRFVDLDEARGGPREWWRVAAILLCAVVAVLPFMVRGNTCGHDFDFHLQSWLSVAQQWHQGVVYPHWLAAANFQTGEPRFVFYPPVSWMLGALLGCVLPWSAVPGAFVLLTLAGCGLSFYALAREWMPRDAAALAAGVYIVNPYALFVMYERTAFGELLGGVWLPLIVLFALRKKHAMLPLALCVAGVWLTNAPAAVMGCYLLAVLAIIGTAVERRWWPVLRAAGGAGLGIGLAAFYIAPAAYERRWVDIARAIGEGMRPQDSFIFGHSGDAFHDQVLRTASWIALGMLLATAAAGAIAWRRGVFDSALPRRVWVSLVAVPALIFFLLMPVSRFLWLHVPELLFLQFPWRWLMVLSIALAMVIGLAVERKATAPGLKSTGPRPTGSLLWATPLLAMFLVLGGSAVFWQHCDEEDMVSAQVAVFHGVGIEGTDEYTTPGTDNGAIQQKLPPVRVLKGLDDDEADTSVETNPDWPPDTSEDDNTAQKSTETTASVPASIKVGSWLDERKAFSVLTSAPAFAVLRLMDYPAWEVSMNGTVISGRPHRADGLMAVPVPAGLSTIAVRFHTTPDVRWGRAISIAAVVIFLLLALRQKRRRNRP